MIYNKANFSTLRTSITQLKTSGLPLVDSINIVQKIKANIKNTANNIGKMVYNKLTMVLNKNNGLKNNLRYIRYSERPRNYTKFHSR